jgi:hypothetical protein
MRYCRNCGSFIATLTLTLALSGCLGKSTPNPNAAGVESVSLSPSSAVSIDIGTTQAFTATAKDANGHTIANVNIQYIVTVPPSETGTSPLAITSAGNACAGTWDATGAICSPGTSGVAVVTAVTNGISSPPTTVYVHQHIDSMVIKNAEQQPYQYDCFPQGTLWNYGAFAYNNGVDITNTVGPITWTSTNATVTTISTSAANLEQNQAQITAAVPGITNLVATVSGTSSNPYPYTTCLVKAIYLQINGQGVAGNNISETAGSSVTITATAIDSLYGIADNAPLAKPPLTWSTSNPEVALFTTTTNTTGSNSATVRANIGGAILTASCTPPSCNVGVLPGLPVYASNCVSTSNPPCTLPNGTNAYSAISLDSTVTTNGIPTYQAWAATTECGTAPGCSSALFALAPSQGKNPISAILTLPRTPNSMMFNHQSSAQVYIGSDQGLMYVAVGNNAKVTTVSASTTPCNVSLCGKVLTISNDGKLVVISDDVSNPSQVYIYNGSSGNTAPPVDLIIPNEVVTAAAFSPDQLKIFLLTNSGNMYVYSTVDALTPISIASSVTDVKFSDDGSFAYVAGTPAPTSVSGYATCNTPTTQVLSGVSTSNPTVQLFPSPLLSLSDPDMQVMLALDPPNIDSFAVDVVQNPLLYNEMACNVPTVTLDSTFKQTSYNLGEGKFTPVYAQMVADGTEMIIVAQNVPAVLVFDIANGTTQAIRLNGNPYPLSASASTDGSQVYVATCDQYQGSTCTQGSVHIVNTVVGGDIQDVIYENVGDENNTNMCSGQGQGAPVCFPNLVAIQPK